MSRIVLFGATGYTGVLTAKALVRQIARVHEGNRSAGSSTATATTHSNTASATDSPGGKSADPVAPVMVLAGRNRQRLDALRAELDHNSAPPIDVAVADIFEPASMADLVSNPDDVLISCVGPFARWGRPAVEAAIRSGATYFDSTGEPEFLLRLFEHDDVRAAATGARLVPAFGYDYVPGNLAGALVLRAAREAGCPATGMAVGYFSPGAPGISGGTAASGAGILLGRSPTFRDGALRMEYAGRRTDKFRLAGQLRPGLSVGGTEHFDLPANFPELQSVGVFLGQLGKATVPAHCAATAIHTALRLPLTRRAVAAIAARTVVGSKGGPASLAGSSIAVAEARDEAGRTIARVVVRGPSPYDLTSRLLAWASTHADQIKRTGTLGPISAFGVDGLAAGCASIGLTAD